MLPHLLTFKRKCLDCGLFDNKIKKKNKEKSETIVAKYLRFVYDNKQKISEINSPKTIIQC